MVEAGVAVGAIAMPFRATVFQGDILDDFRQVLLCLLNLALGHLGLVDAKTRHIDVGVGHLEK